MTYVVDEQVVVEASPELVWLALADPAERSGWWADLDLQAVPGGRFQERWTDRDGRPVLTSGEVLEVVPGRCLRVRWADEDWPQATEVEITLEPHVGSTTVRVRHRGLEHLPAADQVVADHRAGWRMHLRDLRHFAERRPSAAG